MSTTFQKNKENFTCEHCGVVVVGDGYSNHCPECLWSKHVDVHPGDRLAQCGSLMKPVEILYKKGQWRIVHQCSKCLYQKNNKISSLDNMDKVIALSKEIAEK